MVEIVCDVCGKRIGYANAFSAKVEPNIVTGDTATVRGHYDLCRNCAEQMLMTVRDARREIEEARK